MAWYIVDVTKSDQQTHQFCTDCKQKIPMFLCRSATSIQAPDIEGPCEGCGKEYRQCGHVMEMAAKVTVQCQREVGHLGEHVVEIRWSPDG